MNERTTDTALPTPMTIARVKWVIAELWPSVQLTLALVGLVKIVEAVLS